MAERKSRALTGRVAIVTGAGNGIGRTTALAYAKCRSGGRLQADAAAKAIPAAGERAMAVARDMRNEVDTIAAALAMHTALGDVRIFVKAAAAYDPHASTRDSRRRSRKQLFSSRATTRAS